MSSPQREASSDSKHAEKEEFVSEETNKTDKLEIKTENSCEIENCHIDIKTEFNPEEAFLPETEYTDDSHSVKTENNTNIEYESNVDSYHSTEKPDSLEDAKVIPNIKVENDNFGDIESMDSSDATALGNVEACLQDELNIKTDYDHEEHKDTFTIDIKEEMLPAVTETHLISNKLISTTSTVTNTQLGYIRSQTTNTLVMEILPISQTGDVSLTVIRHDPEEILSTPFSNTEKSNHEEFQLNSITGDVMSLEQEAYGSLKSKEGNHGFSCPKCFKLLKSKRCLDAHVKLHDAVDNRALGIIKGKETRKLNQEKLLEISIQERMFKKKIKQEKLRKECKYIKIKKQADSEPIKIVESREMKRLLGSAKTGNYVCTCGKIFKRRSRLETCLRSHNEVSQECDYSCSTCSKQFKARDDLANHRKRNHRKRFPCKFCPTDYDTRKELFKHLQIHQEVQLTDYKAINEILNSKQKLQCFMCSKSFKELSELKIHVMDQHKEPYTCRFCKNKFTKISEFSNHTKTFHPEVEGLLVLDVLKAFSKLVKSWKCDECGIKFNEADKLATHQVDAHNPDFKTATQYPCSDCRRIFISHKGLTSHRRIHEIEVVEEKETIPDGIMCLECRKMCKDINNLTSHMRLHSMDRKYPCKYCDFRFATPEKRKEHAEIHTGDMKFVCFICEYQCTSENRLKHHKMSLKHLNMKEFLLTGKPLIEEPPSECIRDTSKKKSRKRKSEESPSVKCEKKIACDICGENFEDEKVMLEHKQTHPFIEFPNEENPTRIFFK